MNRSHFRSLFGCSLLILVVLLALFHRLLLPGVVLASNDMPFGFIAAHYSDVPEAISGSWQDLNWLGIELPGLAPAFATALRLMSSPELFSKIHAPAALGFLGLCAWVFFRRAGLAPAAAMLGTLAAMLNSSAFSSACWGVVGYVLTWAWCFLALALLCPWSGPRLWLRTMLAGFCLGMAIMDGIDVAALFSLLIAAVVMYGEWLQPGPAVKRLLRGGLRTATVAVCSALISAHALSSLISTQVQGVGMLQQEQKSRAEQWSWATQWSLPKAETLGFALPGVFGYRMDTTEGGNYWGSLGRDPRLDDWFSDGREGSPPPNSGFRFSGGGTYAGALVLLIALWAIHRSLRAGDAVVLASQARPWVWFWVGVAFVGLLLAWGRFAPFYQIAFALPGVSSIRNPVKFGHMTSFALVILFAYGVDGLFRLNHASLALVREKAEGTLAYAWKRVRTADGRFAWLTLGLLGAVGLGWILYASSRPDLERYLQSVQFDPLLAPAIAKFSIGAVGWGFVRYALAAIALFLVLSGWFTGTHARWGAVLLGAVLLLDLVPANRPWIVLVDVPKKYAKDPVVELLKNAGPESRVAILPFSGPNNSGLLGSVYGLEWAQHHFQAENIQSLDVVQMPRPPADRLPFERALQPAGDLASLPVMARRWELTSTRHLIGSVQLQLPWGVEDTIGFLNRALDPERGRFKVMKRFALVPKPWVTQPEKYEDFTAVMATNGPYAVFEFTGALPKAGLYSRWRVETNDDLTLKTIASREFDPHGTVMVAGSIAPPAADAPTNVVTPVEFLSYAPRTIVLRASTRTPAVLLLNDRYDPDWTASVDGQPAELLRCNYIMRGVHLEPGEHTVEFALRPSLTGLYISLITMGVAMVLLGVLGCTGRNSSTPAASVSREAKRPVKAPSGDPGTTRKA